MGRSFQTRGLSRLVALVALAVVPACKSELPAPRPRELPAPDQGPAVRGGQRSPRIANYRIAASINVSSHQVTATETLTWTNTGGTPVQTLPFHLYLNAFKNQDSLFMRESRGEHRDVEASDTGWGWIDVTSIKIAGAELRPSARFLPPDETVLEVPLATAVAPGQTITVEIGFLSQLPEVFSRTGYKGRFIMVAQWFPKIGVRTGPPGGESWHAPAFHVNSEFFADFGTYDVSLTVPDTHVVAATGILAASKANGDGTVTLDYRAEDVHDFAWMLDPYMQVMKDHAKVGADTVEVRVYYRPPQQAFARRHLAAGIAAVEQFSALFVPYPWPIMSIIDPPLDASGASGMEYPTLVTTAGDHALAGPGVRVPEFVTIHEVGHNWFQGMIASNEAREAYLDEGINQWADGVVMARIYGERGSMIDRSGFSASYFRFERAATGAVGGIPSPIATPPAEFVDSDGYGNATYLKTALALRTLENIVGRDRFAAAMMVYAHEWAFKHPTGADFFAVLEREVGSDLSWFIEPAFFGTGIVELAVRSADCEPHHEPRGVFGEGAERKTVSEAQAPDSGAWSCEVVIANEGEVPVPVDIELRFADGSVQREAWDGRGAKWHRLRFDRSSELIEVVLDPDDKILLTDDAIDDHVRLRPDARAAYRAGARAGFWSQTLMQLVGP